MKNINNFPQKIIGEYVISPCLNAFPGSSKVSYWISKKGYVYAAYVFSANSPKVAEEMLSNENCVGYIAFLDDLLDNQALINLYRSQIGDTKGIELDIAKHLIDVFCKAEYGNENGAAFSDLTNVELAYTETEDGLFQIQASVNLVDYVLYIKVDNVVVYSNSYSSLRELIESELRYLAFDELVCVEEDKLFPIYRKRLVGEDIVLDNKLFTIESISDEGQVALKSYAGGKIDETKTVSLNTAARAFDSKQCETSNNIFFESINVDGKRRCWSFKNVSEIEERMVSADYDLPAYDDAILNVHVYSHEPVLTTFEDLLRYLDILADLEE